MDLEMASCNRRFGQLVEHGWKSASKMGSSTSFRLAWTTRSAMVGIPSFRSFPFASGAHHLAYLNQPETA